MGTSDNGFPTYFYQTEIQIEMEVVMNGQYISLDENFTMKHSVSKSTLYCLKNGAIYELQPDQADLLQLLDGTITDEQVMAQYSDESKPEVVQFFKQMREISALRFTTTPEPKRLQLNRVPDRRLESVHLEASGKCNMRCVHCYQAKYVESGAALSHIEILHLLDDLQDMQVNNVGISGGEPLMMPRLAEVLEAIEERDMRISALFSNGLLINKKFIEMAKDLRSRFLMFISLDSIPGVGVTFRGIRKANAQRILERILVNIKLLVSNGIGVVVNTVVNAENIEHLDEMYRLISKLGINSWRLGFPKPTPKFKNQADKFSVDWRSIAEHYLALLRKHLEHEMPFRLQIEYLFREELFEQGDLQTLSNQDFVCDYEERRSGCCVKPNGDVVSCPYCSDLPIGNIHEASIRDIWYSDQMNSIKMIQIGDVVECRGCGLAELCGTGCRANAYFLHGDFHNAKDDHACLAVAFFKERVLPLLREHGMVS